MESCFDCWYGQELFLAFRSFRPVLEEHTESSFSVGTGGGGALSPRVKRLKCEDGHLFASCAEVKCGPLASFGRRLKRHYQF